MSTKIYYGFAVETKKDLLSTIQRLTMDFRAQIKPLAEKHLLRAMATILAARIDSSKMGLTKEPVEVSFAFDSWIEIMRRIRQSERTKERDPQIDVECSLVFFPVSTKRAIGIFYGENTEWFNLWLKYPEVSEYGYWDNTDPQEGVPADEWERRGQDWDKVLGGDGYGIPSLHGLTAEITVPSNYVQTPSFKDLFPHFPSFKARSERLLFAMAFDALGKNGATPSWAEARELAKKNKTKWLAAIKKKIPKAFTKLIVGEKA